KPPRRRLHDTGPARGGFEAGGGKRLWDCMSSLHIEAKRTFFAGTGWWRRGCEFLAHVQSGGGGAGDAWGRGGDGGKLGCANWLGDGRHHAVHEFDPETAYPGRRTAVHVRRDHRLAGPGHGLGRIVRTAAEREGLCAGDVRGWDAVELRRGGGHDAEDRR